MSTPSIKKLAGKIAQLEQRIGLTKQLNHSIQEFNRLMKEKDLEQNIVHQMAVTMSLIVRKLGITPEEIADEQQRIKENVAKKKAEYNGTEGSEQPDNVRSQETGADENSGGAG